MEKKQISKRERTLWGSAVLVLLLLKSCGGGVKTVEVEKIVTKEVVVVKEVVKYKVCKQQPKKTIPWIIKHVEEQTVVEKVIHPEQRKNRVSAHMGWGLTGHHRVNATDRSVLIKNDYGPVFGAQYQRSITDRVNVGGSVYTNGTVSIGLGLDY